MNIIQFHIIGKYELYLDKCHEKCAFTTEKCSTNECLRMKMGKYIITNVIREL